MFKEKIYKEFLETLREDIIDLPQEELVEIKEDFDRISKTKTHWLSGYYLRILFRVVGTIVEEKENEDHL